MKIYLQKIITIFLCLQMLIYAAYPADLSQVGGGTQGQGTQMTGPMADKFPDNSGMTKVGDYPGAVLMPVQLWGATTKSGYYKLPVRSNLTSLVTFAGGPRPDALIDEVVIKRTSQGEAKIIKVNLDEIFRNPASIGPVLEPNDIVYIPPRLPLLSPDVVQIIGITGSIFGIILSAVVISTQLKH